MSKSDAHRNFIINFLKDSRLKKWRLDGKIILNNINSTSLSHHFDFYKNR